MHAFHLFVSVAQATPPDDGLTISKMIDSVPTEPVALFTYALLVVSFAAILWAGRPRGGGPPVKPA